MGVLKAAQLGLVFSAHAEVVLTHGSVVGLSPSILRARGGSSPVCRNHDLGPPYSPRTRR